MAAFAPRYDRRIVEAIRRLDDADEPIAETCRRVGELAWQLGLPRPSYVHLRRLVRAERKRRAEVRAIVDDFASDILSARFVDPYEITGRLHEAAGRAELRARS